MKNRSCAPGVGLPDRLCMALKNPFEDNVNPVGEANCINGPLSVAAASPFCQTGLWPVLKSLYRHESR
jgi:hypothetical protein